MTTTNQEECRFCGSPLERHADQIPSDSNATARMEEFGACLGLRAGFEPNAHTPECNAANDRSPVEICICPDGPDADEPGYYGTANDSEIGPEIYPSPESREIARVTSFEDCIVTGCRLPYGHGGKHDIECTCPAQGLGPEWVDVPGCASGLAHLRSCPRAQALLTVPEEAEPVDLAFDEWKTIHHQSLLEGSDYVLQSARSGRAWPGATLMAARWTFYYAGLRFLIAATIAVFLSLPAFGAEPCKVNVNTATPAELQLLARTGPVLAGRLVSGRPYRHLEAVDAVKGVGPAWLLVNGPHVAFSGKTTCTEKVAAPKVPRVAAQAPKL